jgi:uncharacterized phage infection (PIP) family protein YhgE
MSTKKKTTTQSKKAAVVKKAATSNPSVQTATVTYEYPPAEVIADLNAENELLRDRIRQLTEPKPSVSNQQIKERQSYLNDIASGYNHQISRLAANVDTLIEVSNRIQLNKEETAQCGQAPQDDLTTRLSNYNNYFSYQNDRLEAVITKLQNLV